MKRVLEVSNNALAQYYATLSIRKILSTNFRKISLSVKIEFKQIYFQILFNQNLSLDTVKVAMQGLAEMIILGWHDEIGRAHV